MTTQKQYILLEIIPKTNNFEGFDEYKLISMKEIKNILT